MDSLTHVSEDGKARMVDVGDKIATQRQAKARAVVSLNEIAFAALKENALKKGDAIGVAKIAGIQAAKKTSELIPLCHNIFLSSIDIQFSMILETRQIEILSTVQCIGQTGVEMEALCAVSVAALTIYDMCKALDKTILISEIELLSKSGGRSGFYEKKYE
ncbi:MAG: cyclic pyranopterin monophosphate synthase MoaC [Candidatus Brocadiae bacterium]|nr:cyclic pyranopterin monophosphate synthase MoaC [Candidatus Brocadiia bacterium]